MKCIRLSLKCLPFLEEITQKAARPPSESVNLREAWDGNILCVRAYTCAHAYIYAQMCNYMRITAFTMYMCVCLHKHVCAYMFCSQISSQLTSYWLFPPYRSEARVCLLSSLGREALGMEAEGNQSSPCHKLRLGPPFIGLSLNIYFATRTA